MSTFFASGSAGPAAGTVLRAKSIGSWVPRLTKAAFEKHGFSTSSLLMQWAQIVGPEFARWARPEKLSWAREGNERQGGTLQLRCDPARALEIQYAAAQLSERINSYFGYRAITAVRVVQGQVDPHPAVVKPSPQETTAGCLKVPAELQSIPDGALRASLARLGQRVSQGTAHRGEAR